MKIFRALVALDSFDTFKDENENDFDNFQQLLHNVLLVKQFVTFNLKNSTFKKYENEKLKMFRIFLGDVVSSCNERMKENNEKLSSTYFCACLNDAVMFVKKKVVAV